MTAYRTPALVVRVRPYGETSQVVHLATPEHGLVPAIAQGALRPGGAFQGGLTLAALGEARLFARRGAELERLRAFRQTRDLRGLGRDLQRFHAAQHVIDLVRTWLRPALGNPAIFRAATTALRAIADAPEDSLAAWTVWFEARAVDAAGHRPVLESCAGCGRPLAGRLRFSPGAGGSTHEACAGEGPSAPLSAAALAALGRLYTARLAELSQEPPTPAEVAAVRRVHDLLLPHLLERRPAALAGLPGRRARGAR
jgi:DNA repair protein RecO (recombination protein O)